MNRLVAFGRFTDDSLRILVAVHRLALVGGELLLNARFGLAKLGEHMRVRWELAITPFADSENRNTLSTLYDSSSRSGMSTV